MSNSSPKSAVAGRENVPNYATTYPSLQSAHAWEDREVEGKLLEIGCLLKSFNVILRIVRRCGRSTPTFLGPKNKPVRWNQSNAEFKQQVANTQFFFKCYLKTFGESIFKRCQKIMLSKNIHLELWRRLSCVTFIVHYYLRNIKLNISWHFAIRSL